MRFLLCPQCGIRRFYVKDSDGNQCLVQVTATYEVVPVNEGDSLEGFNTGNCLLLRLLLERERQTSEKILVRNR